MLRDRGLHRQLRGIELGRLVLALADQRRRPAAGLVVRARRIERSVLEQRRDSSKARLVAQHAAPDVIGGAVLQEEHDHVLDFLLREGQLRRQCADRVRRLPEQQLRLVVRQGGQQLAHALELRHQRLLAAGRTWSTEAAARPRFAPGCQQRSSRRGEHWEEGAGTHRRGWRSCV
eukprot:SAG11_NODE_1553_length_4696_cov_1.989776_1_plen_175_part_00